MPRSTTCCNTPPRRPAASTWSPSTAGPSPGYKGPSIRADYDSRPMTEQRIQQQFFESADLLYQAAEQLARPLAMAGQMVVEAITGGNRILCAGQGLASMEADYLAA